MQKSENRIRCPNCRYFVYSTLIGMLCGFGGSRVGSYLGWSAGPKGPFRSIKRLRGENCRNRSRLLPLLTFSMPCDFLIGCQPSVFSFEPELEQFMHFDAPPISSCLGISSKKQFLSDQSVAQCQSSPFHVLKWIDGSGLGGRGSV